MYRNGLACLFVAVVIFFMRKQHSEVISLRDQVAALQRGRLQSPAVKMSDNVMQHA